MSKAELRAYSYTLLLLSPTVNILVPSLLKVSPRIAPSWLERLPVAARLAVVTSNPVVRAYSFTALYSNTYNFVPSLLNDKEYGVILFKNTLLTEPVPVDISKAVPRFRWYTL